jgi:hypothetical protein
MNYRLLFLSVSFPMIYPPAAPARPPTTAPDPLCLLINAPPTAPAAPPIAAPFARPLHPFFLLVVVVLSFLDEYSLRTGREETFELALSYSCVFETSIGLSGGKNR